MTNHKWTPDNLQTLLEWRDLGFTRKSMASGFNLPEAEINRAFAFMGGDDVSNAKPTPEAMVELMMQVVRSSGVSATDIIGPSRADKVSNARQFLMVKMLDCGFSSVAIARFLGNRHHTTILSGARSHHKRMEKGGES